MVTRGKLLPNEKARLKEAQRLAIGNVKLTRIGFFGVRISGGDKFSKPINVNILGPLKSIVLARNRLFLRSRVVSKVGIGTVKRVNKVPKGFVKTIGATTAPRGFELFNNQVSIFDRKKRRKSVLVRIKRRR